VSLDTIGLPLCNQEGWLNKFKDNCLVNEAKEENTTSASRRMNMIPKISIRESSTDVDVDNISLP